MAINYATLAKRIDGYIEYIYPKTVAKLVEFNETQTVEDKLKELDTKLNAMNLAEILQDYYTKSEVKDLTYLPIRLRSVTVSPNVLEAGSTNAITVFWEANRTPAAMNVDGINIRSSFATLIV